ncbi:glycosyltransferase family 4 protein [Gracilibacillus suaedae]|uniref:glycosyltransferase family 4 protein n=1 Tax=Gracilibacillus suaedae TaxID=2820273 RepID=UPI001ABE12E8|nr:glycosyltransferase family 4 protein [Gracilibacillus suaedae]
MKVLHINSYYSTSKFYKNFFDEQIDSGLDIDVFVPVDKGFKSDFDFGSYSKISSNHNKHDRYIFYLKQMKILKDVQYQYNIDDYSIIHAHSLFVNGYVAYKLYKKYKVPYIVTIRNTDINIFFKKMIHLRKIGIDILLNAKEIIFISKGYKKIVLKEYIPAKYVKIINGKSSIIPNGVDPFWLENKPSFSKSKLDRNIKLLQVGDINRNKNQLTTLEVVQKLRDSGYKIELTVVGKDKDNFILKELNKHKFVHYISHTTKENLLNIYRQHDIFVLPSLRETFGLVYVEAMSQGLPVIYSKNQGFDGHFKDGTVGHCVDSLNKEEIAHKIMTLIENRKKYFETNSKLAHNFSWELISEKYLKLYDQ